MPICDGVEAAKRLRIKETKRKSSVILPSETTFLIRTLAQVLKYSSSRCSQRRLSRIDQTALPKCWNERILQQTSEKE